MRVVEHDRPATTEPWRNLDQIALRHLARDFVARGIAPFMPELETTGQLPRDLHRPAAQVGLLSVGFPESVGGSGGDAIDLAIVTEEVLLGGRSTGVCASLFTHGIAVPHIAAHGSPELVDRNVRPTLAGELIGSLGVTEPGAGSDVANLHTRAVRDGDSCVVNGTKTFITSGVRADFVTTAVRTGDAGYGGVSLLVIDKGTPGFEVSRRLDKMDWRCSDTAELSFSDVRVPVGDLVRKEDTGFLQIMQNFQGERLGLAVQAYTTAARCLELVTAWAGDRETFGRPLSSRQVIPTQAGRDGPPGGRRPHLLACRDGALPGRRGRGHRGVDGQEHRRPPLRPRRKRSSADVRRHGYIRESEVERHYRDARILGIGSGANESMNEIITKRVDL